MRKSRSRNLSQGGGGGYQESLLNQVSQSGDIKLDDLDVEGGYGSSVPGGTRRYPSSSWGPEVYNYSINIRSI